MDNVKSVIKAAGLSEVISVFNSAIEINSYIYGPNGEEWDGSTVLAALFASVERAAFERAAQTVEHLGERYRTATPWLDAYNACLGAAGQIRALATATDTTQRQSHET